MRASAVAATALLILSLVQTISADCNGNLYVNTINDITISDSNVYNVNFNVNTDQDPTTVTRNKVISQQKTRFDQNQQSNSLSFYIPATNQMLDGRYHVQAQMQVYPWNDTNNMLCGKIAYSNYFQILTGRSNTDQQPFRLSLGVQNLYTNFDVRKRNCTDSYCVEVNMSGVKPANMTIDPSIQISQSQDQSNMSVTAEGCYPGSYLLRILQNTTDMTRALSDCNDKVLGISTRLDTELSTSQKNNSDMLDKFDQCMKSNADATTYKNAHPYTVEEVAIPSILFGMVLLFFIIAWYNRRGHRDSPQEMVR